MMRNYLCWDPGAVRQVINPYAEHTPDGLFRAVHSEWNLKVCPPVGKSFREVGDAAFEEMTPAAFLADFLREDRPHALAAILGETGSGKSHLVHWMRLHLRTDERRLVLVVRKSGTSLRAIVRMIIDELLPEERQSFLDTFNNAGDGTLSRDGRRHELLNHLAQTIREDVPSPDADEIEQELVQYLPHLLQDPHMREAHFLRDGTVVAQVVDHIFADSNARDRPDQRRSFAVEDLPLGGSDFLNAAKQARDAIQLIELDRAANLPLAVGIINRNLDRAIARALSFSGDRVEELMVRLRAHLKRQGRELVLLVEEFARLQGIDRVLLQAITSHGDDHQCRMRTAIAVTTGFFESVAETAYMRTTHIVDMDRSAGRVDGRGVTPESLGEFAAKYLNAARLGRDGVERWSETAKLGEMTPSACAKCSYEGECHKTFGAVDRYGLYPFTSRALWNAAKRVDHSMPTGFNPRVLQNNVLAELLDNFAPTIQVGEFPPRRLLEKLGGDTALPLPAQRQLETTNSHLAERWIALLEIYDGTGAVRSLPPPLFGAFDLPEIPEADRGEAEVRPDDGNVEPETTKSAASASREDLAIQAWVNGGYLDQNTANELRPLVFSAIADGIDWDILGLARTTFAQKTSRPFQQTSVSFERQTTQVREDLPVKLKLLANVRTGIALQGLLRAKKQQFRWDFPDGHRMLAAFLDCLEDWVSSVQGQLRATCAPSPRWKPATAALELLCAGAAIGGRIKPDASIAEMIEGAFANWPSECASTAPEMRSLYGRLLKYRDKLVETARSQVSSMKGGRAGAMLDPRRVVGAIRDLRSAKWRLGLEPPDGDRDDLAKMYREVKAGLEPAAAAEWAVRRQWLSEVKVTFGAEASRAAIVGALATARQAALDAGVSSQNVSRPLQEALELFGATQFDDSVAAARALAKYDDPLSALAHFGRGRRAAVEAATRLRLAAAHFLDTVERNLDAFGQDHDTGHADIEVSLGKIDGALVEIGTELAVMMSAHKRTADAA